MTDHRIYLSPPDIGEQERQYVTEAFNTNWIAPLGPHVDDFEKELSSYIGPVNAAVLSSGTAALHLALLLLGVKRDDHAIAQSFTFCGSVNPITYVGANPVLVDSEPDTWNMDPGLMEKAINDLVKKNRKPKAIIYVHLYGMPAKVDEIQKIAARYHIPLIEDAAEALGSRYDNKQVGRFGEMSILSFNGNKIITTGGGGALLSANRDWISKAKFLATQARDEAPHYQHSEIGYNYRMSNVSAGIGRGQLMGIERKVDKRRDIFRIYEETLSGLEALTFQKEPPGARSNRWLTCVCIEDQKIKPEELRLYLEKDNIESRPFWKPMHLQPVYHDVKTYTNGVSENLFNRGLCLPSGSGMTDEDIERVVRQVKKFFRK